MGPFDAVLAAWSLDPGVFRGAAPGARFGVAVVLAAGLSLAVGQSLALFAVGVRSRRSAASLLVQSTLFAIGLLTWATSTWVVATVAFGAPGTWSAAVAATGLAHAPQLFGAFVLVPYFGSAIGALLSVWTLLAVWVATAGAFDLSASQSLTASVGGWLVVHVFQRTVGRPLETLGWWAGWFGDPLAPQETHPHAEHPHDPEDDAEEAPTPPAAVAGIDPRGWCS